MDETLNKIAIIGASGAGKTMFARMLHRTRHIKVFHLDRLFYKADWEKVDPEDRIDVLQRLIMAKDWIIDGTYINSSELHLDEADVIIFLDISPFKCCYRIIKRHIEFHAQMRRDIPLGTTNRLSLSGIFKALLFPIRGKRKLENKLHKFPEKVIRLCSAKETIRFLAQLELHNDGKGVYRLSA